MQEDRSKSLSEKMDRAFFARILLWGKLGVSSEWDLAAGSLPGGQPKCPRSSMPFPTYRAARWFPCQEASWFALPPGRSSDPSGSAATLPITTKRVRSLESKLQVLHRTQVTKNRLTGC